MVKATTEAQVHRVRREEEIKGERARGNSSSLFLSHFIPSSFSLSLCGSSS